MKNLIPVVLLFLMSCSATKRCPPAIVADASNCISDSVTVKTNITGSWNWVKSTYSGTDVWPCQTGVPLGYQFDATGIYKFLNNGNVLTQTHYMLSGNAVTTLYDSASLYVNPSICNGFLVLRKGTDTVEIYERSN